MSDLVVDIRFDDQEPGPQPGRRFFRVLHDWELAKFQVADPRLGQLYKPEGWDWRAKFGFPEVQHLVGSHKVTFDEPWQRLSFEMNPGMRPQQWRILYDDHRAFTDRTGFWTDDTHYSEYRPVKDFINGLDLQGDSPLPEFNGVRVCGGATVSGVVDGSDLIVDTLRQDQPPTWSQLQLQPWLYFHAVNCHVTGDKRQAVSPFPQNDGRRVLVPLFAMPGRELRYPLAALQEVTGIADPYRIYFE